MAESGSLPKRTLFGTDGIRGVANEPPLTPQLALAAGRAIGKQLHARAHEGGPRPFFVIGKDTRASGDFLETALAAGLASQGVDVELAGVVPTPAVAFLVKSRGAAGGCVISASHNPFFDNGLKFFDGQGLKLPDATEAELEADILAELGRGGELTAGPRGAEIGRVTHLSGAAAAYVDFVLSTLPKDFSLEGWTIALDCANGASCHTSPAALRGLGAEVHVFHADPNGLNINESCGSTHPERIAELVQQTGARIGLAHDGDADRLLFCDELGSALDGDELLCLAALALLEERALKHNTLVVTVMTNFGMEEALAAKGGKVVRTSVGDRYVLEAMLAQGFNLGGEQSGHLIFSDYLSTGDGLLSALQILRVVAASGKPLSEVRKALAKFPQAQKNLKVARKPPLDTLAKLQQAIREVESALAGRGRVLVRYSGTEPKIRLLVEGPDAALLEKYLSRLALVVEEELC
jgi:phosphoglucosamine mutase